MSEPRQPKDAQPGEFSPDPEPMPDLGAYPPAYTTRRAVSKERYQRLVARRVAK